MIELQSVWGWQPALYLFLGGMGAGAFVVAAVLYLRCGSKAGKRWPCLPGVPSCAWQWAFCAC